MDWLHGVDRGANLRPVFVDVDPHTGTVDARCIEAAITPETRAEFIRPRLI